MQLQFLAFILLRLCTCGHIYVSDPQLYYQNTAYLTSAQLYFKLETDLFQNEVLKIVWPFTFNGPVKLSIYTTTSTAALSAGTAITDSTTQAYLVRAQAKINAQQWYILNISSVAQSPTVQFYTAPIQMSTHSGMTVNGIITDYLMYDYNTACGFIAVAPAPGALSSVVVSATETGTAAPSTITENKYFEASYPVYITLLSSGDYEYGGTFQFTITNGFKWQGTCEASSKTCAGDTACIKIQALSAISDYTCTVTDSLITFKRYQNASKLSINHQDSMRIKITVKNPSILATGGINVQLVSNYANYIYEVLDKPAQFQTIVITLNTENAQFLWGLIQNLAQNKGCPVRIYFTKHDGIAVWNKISLPFYPLLTFPESVQGFYIYVNVKAASLINDLSIYTDVNSFGSKVVSCVTADKYINCSNVGKLIVNQTKYVKFAFIADTDDYDTTEFAFFGQITIYNQQYGSAITQSVIPKNIIDSIKVNVLYTPDVSGNAVFDMSASLTNGFTPQATYTAVTTKGPNVMSGRSSIKYTNEETNLFFPITTSFITQCCAGSTGLFYDCTENVNAECADVTGAAAGTFADTLILKMLANKNAISLNQVDQDTSVPSETNVYKGVELFPPSEIGKGMFGMDKLVTVNSNQDYLCLADKSVATSRICSTFSRYVNYNDAKTTLATQYLYNQWFNTADGLELHTVCYAGHAASKINICGAIINTAMGVMIRHIKLSIVANALYPQQTELDFIMCFRYADKASTSLGKDDTTKLATTGLINAQIINFRATISEVFSQAGTMFRVGILNYFEDTLTTDHAVNYVPTLLRIGGYMQNAEVTTNSGIAFFFDGDNIVIGESKLSATMPLNPTECASPLAIGTACRYFKVRQVNDNIPTGGLHKDYYPGLNAIIIGGSAVTALSEFNYYIPVWIKVPAFTFAFIGLINNHATFPTVSSVYKLYGTVEIAQTAANAWKSSYIADGTALTILSLWTAQATTGTETTKLNSAADWEVDGVTLGALNTHGTSAVVKISNINKLAYSSLNAIIYPGDYEIQAVIDASFDSASSSTETINDDTTAMATAKLTYAASMHFMIHSQIKYWSGDLTWSLTNITNPFQAKCVDMTISSYYDTTHKSISYVIICPYEGKLGTGNTIVTVNPTLTLGRWEWPDYYGESTYVGAHLRYMWTDKVGNLKAYLAEKKIGSKKTNCTLGTTSPVFALSTSQKKAQIYITPFNSIALLPATTPFQKEKEKIIINIIVSAQTNSTLTTSKCSSGIPSIKCSVLKSENTFSFTLFNTDTINAQNIPKSQVILTFWLSSTSVVEESLRFQANIFAYFYKKYTLQESAIFSLINECNNQQAWTSGAKEDRTITVSDPNQDVMVIGARTAFSFSFNSNYVILDASKFTLNLAFLASANINLISNIRCAVYSGNTISHLFDKFTYSTLTAVEFEYKQQDITLDNVAEIGTVNYTFLCNGGNVIQAAPSSSSKIYVANIVSSIIGEGYCNDQSTGYASLHSVQSSLIANVTLAKTFTQAGQDSTYTFNIKVAAKTETSATNVVTTSIRFKAGSYFYVEFARDISPRFNKLGIIRCYQEGNPTYCKYESERRIAFVARTDLDHSITYGHNFSIVGIQRPFEFKNYKKMYVALVPYLGTLNSLEFQDSTSVEDAASIDQVLNTLPVVYYSQDLGTSIRSTYSLTMHIKFPSGTVQEKIPIWVDFPPDFDEAMFLGWSPICQFKNVKIGQNDTITNYASSCTLNSSRRIKLNMTTDSKNTDTKLYALTISGIPTYNYEQYYVNAPIVWFENTASTTVQFYRTNLGYFNGTYNLKTFTFSDTAKQLLTWDSNIPKCYIGTYRCNAKLSIFFFQQYLILEVKNLENFFYDVASFTSKGTYSDLFKFNPSVLSIQTGKSYTQFEIAPKASTATGLYQLQWDFQGTNQYSAIPPLYIIALNSQTSINAASTTYEVPNGGKSLPIIFDFTGKMPETDVIVTGAAKSLEVGGTTYITSKYVSFQQAQKTLTYSEKYNSSQIQFVVNGLTGKNEIPSAMLSWTLSGTNAISYSNPSNITVTVVSAQIGTPELTLNTPETTNQAGFQTITVKCSQAGTLYYVISQSQSSTQIEFSAIKAASEDANILQTEIGTVFTNPSRTFYGYHLISNAQTNYIITIRTKLQSEATYYIRTYCVNQMDVSSLAKDATWKQSSNGGKPLISAMKFSLKNTTNETLVTLTIAQKKEVTCIICQLAKVEKDKVFGTNGISCDEQVNVVKNTTTNSTLRILETTANTTEFFVVMPNLFISDGSLNTVKTTLESAAFSTALSASTTLTGVALNTIACSINSAYPCVPFINSPSVSLTENSITFTWTGANNTDGFVFVGLALQTNTVEPTALQLKKNSGYTFEAFNKAFYYKSTTISVTVSPIDKCVDYKYYWVATNEDPETYQYTTGIKSGTTKTIGCATFGSLLTHWISCILLIFVVILT